MDSQTNAPCICSVKRAGNSRLLYATVCDLLTPDGGRQGIGSVAVASCRCIITYD